MAWCDAGWWKVFLTGVEKQFATAHLVFSLVAHVDQHGHKAAGMIQVHGPVVSHSPLVDIHADPELVRFMFNLTQFRPLFIDSVFTIRDVTRLGQLNLAAVTFPDFCELVAAPINEKLTMKSVE